eukprot:CAMPEP_0174704048 /NCGR_PEP_ID=MMETSP1094-20130205/7782_1 /TAXON_ID=156173 /ORGANISM="Chrysochromulina brevifilum, Strain UTEX LB 985" /LENGTH=109 /DNA_ID=CAMNT_0015902051 /DNA_START=307 /DNA_END=636 /DNA_ORIENTATION=+
MATTFEPTSMFVNACLQRQAMVDKQRGYGLPYNEVACKQLHSGTFGELLDIIERPHTLLNFYVVEGGPSQVIFHFIRDRSIALLQGCYVALLGAAWSNGDLVTNCAGTI